MTKNVSNIIIKRLTEGADLDQIILDLRLTPTKVLNLLETVQATEQLSIRARLSRIQVELLAHRHAPHAMDKLCGLLNESAADLRMRGALAILKTILAADTLKLKQDPNPKNPAPDPLDDTQSDHELLAALSELLGQKRRANVMAPDDSTTLAT